MKLRTLITMLLLVVLVLQGLEPRFLGLSYDGASPLNPRWDGTTKLVELAKNLGYEVYVVHSWFSYFLRAPREKCGIVMLVSPERPLPIIELVSLVMLIRARGYNLIVADEGPYSMPLLKSLGIDVGIDVKRMLPSIVVAKARIGGDSMQLVLDYASPLILNSRVLSTCREIAVYKGLVFGILCRVHGSMVVVLGDGTAFTNAALRAGTMLNPNVRFLRVLLNKLCPRGGVLAIDASSYPIRPALVSELESMGLKGTSLLQAIFTPSRLLKPAAYRTSLSIETSIAFSILASLIIVLIVTRALTHVAPQEMTPRKTTSSKPHALAKSIAMLLNLCERRDLSICSNFFSKGVFRKKLDVDNVEKMLRIDSEIRRKILEAIEYGQREVASTSRASGSA